MVQGVGEAPGKGRVLAWVAGVVVVVAAVGAGLSIVGSRGPDAGFVSAAGRTGSTVEVPTTTGTVVPTSQPPVTTAPPPTVARSTTVPRAAAAVLRAIASTVPPTTQPPATTTTTRVPVTTIPTTSSTVEGRATATLVNDYPDAVRLTVDGRTFDMALGDRQGPRQVVLFASGDDVVEVRVAADLSCMGRNAGDLLQPGGSYRIAVVAGASTCRSSIPVPVIEVTPL